MATPATAQKQTDKIIWAIDPTLNPFETKNLVKELRIWSRALQCEVLPVSVFSKSTFGFPVDLALPWAENYEAMAARAVDRFLKRTRARNFLPPQILFTHDSSTRKMASTLARYAEAQRARLIFVKTRDRLAWNPLRLGGFAETLVATSRVPVLLLNPRAQVAPSIREILFATDFGRDSKVALDLLGPWARALNAKVLLFNQIEMPAAYASELNGFWPAPDLNAEFVLKDLSTAREKTAQAWADHLQNQNVEVDAWVQRQRKLLSRDIVDAAKKKKTGLIALASSGGPMSQALLGSVARDVLGQSPCPVLIFHRPKAARNPVPVRNRNSRPVTHSTQEVRHV